MYRIGYDAKRLFNNFTGLGNYSRTLLKNLADYYPDFEYFLFTPRVQKNSETHFFLTSPLYHVHHQQQGNKALWRSRGIRKDLKEQGIQLYHGLSHEIPFGMEKTGIPAVVTIHDLIFKHYPDQYTWIDRQIYDRKFKYACQHANAVIAISESTKQDIVDLYRIPPEKVHVIYQGCHERFMQEKSQKTLDEVRTQYHLPSSYLLSVGSLIERKNVLGIVQAMALLPHSMDLPLVIVGKGAAYRERIEATARRLGLSQRILFIQPDFEDLPAIYQQAALFIYPSFYEGFGIPVLEALFSKTPVITSNVSSLPEAGGPDAYLVDPNQPAAIAEGIEQILTDTARRELMVQQGYAYAQQFRGEGLTRQMVDLYRQILD